MFSVISVPTIMICTFIAMVASSAAMMAIWRNSSAEKAAGLWSLAFSMGAFGGLALALRNAIGEYSIPISSMLAIAAYVLFWSAFRTFGGLKSYIHMVYIVPALWLVAYLTWAPLRVDANTTIIVHSSIVATFTFLAAYVVYSSAGMKNLPTSAMLTAFLLLHGGFHLMHVGFAIGDPSTIVAGRMTAPWWKFLMLENFLNVVVVAISCLMMIKERSEERHKRAAETDALTGIANRRAFVKQTEKALSKSKANAVLAILDIDHFKPVNDRYGHQAGDRALIEFARTIEQELPEDALFGRIGGEEFAVFLTGESRDNETLLQQLRIAVEKHRTEFDGWAIPMTVSIGAATVEKAGDNFDHLVAAADCALYIAKEEGRNQLVMFSPSQRLRRIVEKDGEKRIGLADERVSRKTLRGGKPLKAS